jgi:TRAP-type C4-dicarboxylate transport system permease small subunit
MDGVVKRLRRGAEIVLALMLASMFVCFLVQVVFRYALNLPVGWTIEYVAIAWLWGILFGYAFVVRDEDVIRLDIFYAAVPERAQRVMDVVSGLACAGILAWSLPKAYEYVTFMKIERTSYMRIPFDLVFSIYLPFAVSVIVRSLMTVWGAVTGHYHHADPIRSPGADESV